MHIRVLGAAAGGGFPQWNCGCPNCRDQRAGRLDAPALTQECVAVSADGNDWLLLNASPEIRTQVEAFPALHPRAARHSPIAAIVLTNGDLDHCLGLLSLRESHPITVLATAEVRRGFTAGNVLYRTLERFPGQVTWRALVPNATLECAELAIEAVAAPGKAPIHLEGAAPPAAGDNIGLVIHDRRSDKRLAYFSAAAAVSPAMRTAMARADCVFFDGTFWSEDELVVLGLGSKRAAEMAHLPVGGPGGSLEALAGLKARHRYYIHINNTNPALRPDSKERQQVRAAGWELARDGMEIRL